MRGAVTVSPSWAGWRWLRMAGLICCLLLFALAVNGTHSRGELAAPEPYFLVALSVLFLLVVFSIRPTFFAAVFVLTLAVMQFAIGGQYDGAAWFLAYGLIVDVNSRKPAWLWFVIPPALVAAAVVVRSSPSHVFASLAYILVLTLLGQFIRLTFSGMRSAQRVHALERALEARSMRQAVHDSAGARLTQALMLARTIRAHPELPVALQAPVDSLLAVTAAGASEVESLVKPPSSGPGVTPNGKVEETWAQATKTLRSAGFRVVDHIDPMPPMDPSVKRAILRTIDEATANICRHALPRTQVTQTLRHTGLTLEATWVNESMPDGPASLHGLGLAGIRARAEELGGHVEGGKVGGHFRLHVSLPEAGQSV